MKQRRLTVTVSALLGLVALFTGLFVSKFMNVNHHVDPKQFHGTLLETPRDVTPFTLTGIDKAPYTAESLKGHWTLMFFGFTRCGYLCPVTMGELGKLYRYLEDKGVQPLPKVVMVSIDPKRDSAEKLSQYVTAFDRHFYGAVGDEKEIRHLSHELGIAYMTIQNNPVEANTYDIDHTGTVMLFNPQGKLAAFFTSPQQFMHLAEDYLLLI